MRTVKSMIWAGLPEGLRHANQSFSIEKEIARSKYERVLRNLRINNASDNHAYVKEHLKGAKIFLALYLALRARVLVWLAMRNRADYYSLTPAQLNVMSAVCGSYALTSWGLYKALNMTEMALTPQYVERGSSHDKALNLVDAAKWSLKLGRDDGAAFTRVQEALWIVEELETAAREPSVDDRQEARSLILNQVARVFRKSGELYLGYGKPDLWHYAEELKTRARVIFEETGAEGQMRLIDQQRVEK